MRLGFYLGRIWLLQFLGVFENPPKLRLKERGLFFGEIKSREFRDVRHVDLNRLGHVID